MIKIDCPECKNNIMKSYDLEVKLRAKLIKWTQKGMFAICKSCGGDVPIDAEILKSIQSTFVYEIDEKLGKERAQV